MLTFKRSLDGYHSASGEMAADLRRRATVRFREREREKAALTTRADFEAYRDRVRERFLEAIGGLPEERTPLRATCTGTIDRGSFTIEKTLYQSQPEFYVTASLYVPKSLARPAPAVLFVIGHTDLGKAYFEEQTLCASLAENGFVALLMDPIGQGERFQYWDPATQQRLIGGCTTEHTHSGLQHVLTGGSVARNFIWDGIRSVDYLCSRPEVDPARIAVTGNSGGGTQSCFLMLAEPRLAAAAPCTFVTSLETYLKTGQPQDGEQIVRGAIAFGPDHDDYLRAMAPKPVIVGAAAYDFFPIEGTIESVQRARAAWALYGAEERLALSISPVRHTYPAPMREAVVRFFLKHLVGTDSGYRAIERDILTEEALYVTPTGKVLDAFPNSRTVFDLGRERMAARGKERAPLSPPERRSRLAAILGVPGGRYRTIYPRVIHEETVDGYPCEKIYFFSAPEIAAAAVMIHPPAGETVAQTDLVLLEHGTNDIPAERPRLERLLAAGHRLLVFDARATGAVAPELTTPPTGNEYRLASDAMMLGISTLGLRVFDVLRGYDYLLTRPDVDAARIGLVGVGTGAILGYLAAALEPGFSDLHFAGMLASYRSLVETRLYNRDRFGLQWMAWGLLPDCDLPELGACLAPRPTCFEAPCDARGEPVAPGDFTEGYRAAAHRAGAPADWRPEVIAASG
ncbi:MAG: acetylxylan esterase [Armatimonadetes bacterium]|nr:acetylxylan esterase [Armatimonadota bacterium]